MIFMSLKPKPRVVGRNEIDNGGRGRRFGPGSTAPDEDGPDDVLFLVNQESMEGLLAIIEKPGSLAPELPHGQLVGLITIAHNHFYSYSNVLTGNHETIDGRLFLTPAGELVEAAQTAIAETLGYETELSTAGGTSDGRFIAPLGSEVLELGLLNGSIHQVDERTPIEDLDLLQQTYLDIIRRLIS